MVERGVTGRCREVYRARRSPGWTGGRRGKPPLWLMGPSMAKGRLGRRRQDCRGRRWKRLRWTSIEAKLRPWLFDAVSRFRLAAVPCLSLLAFRQQIYANGFCNHSPRHILKLPKHRATLTTYSQSIYPKHYLVVRTPEVAVDIPHNKLTLSPMSLPQSLR